MDYTKQKNREKALDKINSECLKAFNESNIQLSKDVIICVKDMNVEISYREQDKESPYYGRSAFASEIRIESNFYILSNTEQENKISVGSCGSFNPEYKGAYWRAIHAGEVLKHWEIACDIVNTYCKKYRELVEEIDKQTK